MGAAENATQVRQKFDFYNRLYQAVRAKDPDKVKEANQFNEAAPSDKEYIAIKVRVRYIGTDEPNKPQQISGSSFKITGEKNVVYESPSIVAPEPQLDASLFAGGEIEGWEVLSVATGEQNLRVVFEPLFSFGSEQTRYLATE